MRGKSYRTWKKRWAAGVLAFVLMLTAVPAQEISAAPKKLSMKDFIYYSSNGYEMSFLEVEDPYGTVSSITGNSWKTYRGIKAGSKLSTVKSKYGKADKKKFDTKESFNKYIREYYFMYRLDISKWKNYVEYTYKKNTKEDRRLRFYLDKKDKVIATIYIYKYKNFKLSKKAVNIGFSFQAPKGKKITTKTVAGKEVQVLPANTKVTFNRTDEIGILGQVLMYDTKNRQCGYTSIPIKFADWGYPSGTKLEKILNDELRRYNPSNGKYIDTNLKKLGKYNYFELVIYSVNAKGGYKRPARYYFRLK